MRNTHPHSLTFTHQFCSIEININSAICDETILFIDADFNGDQKLDLAVANSGTNNVTTIFSQGAGSFSATLQTTPTGGMGPNSLISVDLNGDGFLDLVTANQLGTNVSVMLGATGGKFGNGTVYSVGTGPFYVASSDLNGDLQPDLISSNGGAGNVSVLLSQCN